MKKIINIMLFLICFCLLTISCVPYVNADGGMIMYKMDRWEMLDEDQQLCAINYKQGIQNMILSVNTGEEITGEKAVWIFPVPAKPEKTVINIVEGFPELNGYDVESKAENSVSGIFDLIRLSQIYTMPLLIFTGSMGGFASQGMKSLDGIGGIEGVTIHESIEKSGLTTELISTVNSDSFSNYLTSKDLDVPPKFKLILDEYIGKEYSFVVSWISDVEKFKLEQPEGYIIGFLEDGKIDEARELFNNLDYDSEKYEKYGFYYYLNEIFKDVNEGKDIEDYYIRLLKERRGAGNILSVFISFPTEKMYYPLKPTSVYGSKKVPAVIYVMDYVEPELYPEIKPYTETNYFSNWDSAYFPENLRDFFSNFEKEESDFTFEDMIHNHYSIEYYEYLKDIPHFKIKDLKYTKIEIDAPSDYLTEDLWIERGAPLRVFLADFFNRFAFWFGLFFFIVCSCLASLLSGMIIFGFKKASKTKFVLFGLWNFLTLFGFSVAAYANKIDVKFAGLKEIKQDESSFRKKFLITFFTILIILILFLTLIMGSLVLAIITIAFLALFVLPFLLLDFWGYQKNKRITEFVILFSILFIVLTILFQYLLKLMFV